MAASAKKKNKKGKTLTLTDFLAEDGGGAPIPSYPPTKPTSWADETDDLEADVSTSWHTEEDAYCTPPIHRSILPTAPRAARESAVDRSRLPHGPPFTAFLGNLPYEVTEDSIKDFFHGLSISAVRLPREPSNPERLKGFGYAEFDDLDSLLSALNLNKENLGNRRIRVDIADQSNEKEREERSTSSWERNRGGESGPDKTDSDWRVRQTDEEPGRDDGFEERSRDRYESDRYGDGSRKDGADFDGGRERFRDRYEERDRRETDRGFDSRSGGRRTFGSGFRRDYEDRPRDGYRGAEDRHGDREERYDRQEERAPVQRPKLNLKPRTVPKEDKTDAPSGRAASIFGGAKPVDTASKEREVEDRLKKEQERLLEEEKGREAERRPRERHPSWRGKDPPPGRSRTGSESSQPGSLSGRGSRRRESERSVESEVLSGHDEDPPSPGIRPLPLKDALPLKVVLAPPPKENAWAKRRTQSGGNGHLPLSPSSNKPPELSSSADGGEPQRRDGCRDENKPGAIHQDRGPSQGRGGASGPRRGRGGWGDSTTRDRRKESDRKDVRRERNLRPTPEPKKYVESPVPKFSSESKYAALLMEADLGDST